MQSQKKLSRRPFGSKGVGRDLSRLLARCVLAWFTVFVVSGTGTAFGKPRDPYGPVPCGPAGTESQAGDSGKKYSDPINLSTGDYQLTQADLFIPGRGIDFQFIRYYRSRSGKFSMTAAASLYQPIGMNWDHSYNLIARKFVAAIDFHNGRGRVVQFSDTGGTGVYTRGDDTGVMEHNASTGHMTYRDASGLVYVFDHQLSASNDRACTTITDRNGNTVTLAYDTDDRLVTITDTLGNQISLEYYDAPGAPQAGSSLYDHLVWRVTDHAGRMVEYQYSNQFPSGTQHLLSVTLPAVETSAPFPLPTEHARFQNGRTWQFTYWPYGEQNPVECTGTTNPNSYWAGQIRAVIDPNGNQIVENYYTMPTIAVGRYDYRVHRQVYGDGEYNYKVTDTSGGVLACGNMTADFYVWVNDRRGYVTRLHYAGDDAGASGTNYAHRRLLSKREYLTPAPDAAQQSDGTANMPSDHTTVGRYRDFVYTPSDDDDYATSDWNVRTFEAPNGNIVEVDYYGDLHPGADPRRAQAVVARRRKEAAGSTPSTNPLGRDSDGFIEEKWGYNHPGFGGCCGANSFATGYLDGRGSLTLYRFDDNGNVLSVASGIDAQATGYNENTVYGSSNATAVESAAMAVTKYEYTDINSPGMVTAIIHPEATIWNGSGGVSHSRRDEYTYYSSGSMKGRLEKIIVDADQSGHTGLKLTTTYLYNAVGDVTKITEPDGDYTQNIYNQAGQLVRTSSFASGSTVVMAQTDWYYDANGNNIRTDIKDLDETLAGQGNDLLAVKTTIRDYDSLNFVTRVAQEKGDVFLLNVEPAGLFSATTLAGNPNWVVTDYSYDKAKNLVRVQRGEATNGNQERNQVAYEYDDRGLVSRVFEGGAGTGKTNALRVKEYTYDAKGRRVVESVVGDYNQNGTGLSSRMTSTSYDAFDRPVSVIDPMGNETRFTYDDSGNLRTTAICGAIGHDLQPAGYVGDTIGLLAYQEYTYDALNRRITSVDGIFDLVPSNPIACPPLPPPSGLIEFATTTTAYNANSSIQWVQVPATDSTYANPGRSESFYDTAGRPSVTRDASGNTMTYVYDDASNVIEEIATEQGPGTTSETYTTVHAYDGLNRRIGTIQGIYGTLGPQNTTTFGYDSRGNVVRVTDPNGNVTTHQYDGLSRRVQTTQVMPGDDIDTRTVYDDASRVVELLDDKQLLESSPVGTQYDYDGIGREITRVFPDGTTHSTAYDAIGNPELVTDARGVAIDQSFDLNNRMTSRVITKPLDSNGNPIIGGSDYEIFEYDGLGRVTSAENNFALVTREYDSRGNMVSETMNADAANTFPSTANRKTTYAFNDDNNQSSCTYPGGRVVYHSYDGLNRLTGLWETNTGGAFSDPIAEYSYIGAGRVKTRTSGNGVLATYEYSGHSAYVEPTGMSDKGFGNVATIEHTFGGTLLEGRMFTWDHAGNKTRHEDLRTAYMDRKTRIFDYDAANRLIETEGVHPGNSSLDGVTEYTLDGVHNRTSVVVTSGVDSSGAAIGTYIQDEGFNRELNQYTRVPALPSSNSDLETYEYLYDENGSVAAMVEYPRPADLNGDYIFDLADINAFNNAFTNQDSLADLNGDEIFDLQDINAWTTNIAGSTAPYENVVLSYDWRNQLIKFVRSDGMTEAVVADFAYDAFNRRVSSLIDTDGVGGVDSTTYFVYGGQAAWQLFEEYDDPDSAATLYKSYVYGNYIDEVLQMRDHPSTDDFYYHQDDQFSVYAMTDDDGVGDIVVERYSYGDFGQVFIANAAGVGRTESSYGNRHTYTGRLLEIQLGLAGGEQFLGYRFRYLLTNSGTFAQRDPAGYSSYVSIYDYVSSGPMKYSDPMGLWPWSPLPGAIPPRDGPPILNPEPEDFDPDDSWIPLLIPSIVFEPLDWCLTGVEICKDPSNPFSYCGLVPFVPAVAKKPLEKIWDLVKVPLRRARVPKIEKITDLWDPAPSDFQPFKRTKPKDFDLNPTLPPSIPAKELLDNPFRRIRAMPPDTLFPAGYWKWEEYQPPAEKWFPLDMRGFRDSPAHKNHFPFPMDGPNYIAPAWPTTIQRIPLD